MSESQVEKKGSTIDSKTKKFNTDVKGIQLVKIAAFCFAIISWIATSEGLKNYVFSGNAWQSYLISFGIQAILFVLNLKLPTFFNRIGKNFKGKWSKRLSKPLVIAFYVLFIFASSWFSYVYIANYVYESTQYVDSNVILDSTYVEIINETEKYINEDIKAMQLIVNEKVSELKITIQSNDFSEETDVMSNLELAQNRFEDAQLNYEGRKDAADLAKAAYELVKEDPNITTTTKRLRYEAYIAALDALEVAREELTAARDALANAQLEEIDNSLNGIVENILSEILKDEPDVEVLQSSIDKINDLIVTTDMNEKVTDFSEVALQTQELNLAIEKYITLRTLYENSNDESAITITTLKKNMLTDEVVIPEYGTSSFNEDVVAWKEYWKQHFQYLGTIVNSTPDFSENEAEVFSDNNVVNVKLLEEYNAQKIADEINDVVRENCLDINEMERAKNLLTSEYPFLAWFSLGLAIFFDVASLLAGLFIYFTNNKKNKHEEKS